MHDRDVYAHIDGQAGRAEQSILQALIDAFPRGAVTGVNTLADFDEQLARLREIISEAKSRTDKDADWVHRGAARANTAVSMQQYQYSQQQAVVDYGSGTVILPQLGCTL